MNLGALWTEIEAEQTWRTDELRFFHNQVAKLHREDERKIFRKSLVLLLYAHFEGFCKFAFAHYIKAINSEGLTCREVNAALGAATLARMFAELRNPEKKAREFGNALPDDAKLHRFAREREFVEKSSEFETRFVTIPDDVVDTESNLKPVVMKKNLYKIGLDHNRFSSFDGQISKLLQFRNNIAHGVQVAGLEHNEYDQLRSDVSLIMTQIKRDVMSALQNKAYLRT
jgi:hypothetical protein